MTWIQTPWKLNPSPTFHIAPVYACLKLDSGLLKCDTVLPINFNKFWIQPDEILMNTLNFVVVKATLWIAKATPHSVFIAILLLSSRRLSL